MGLAVLCRIFPTFRLNVRNIPHNIASPIEHYYTFEWCYAFVLQLPLKFIITFWNAHTKEKEYRTSPSCTLYTLMPQVIPLFTLPLVCTWYESFYIYLNLSSYYHMHVVGLAMFSSVSWSLGFLSEIPLVGRPNTKPRDHDTLNLYNRWFFCHVWVPTWTDIHWNNIWLRARLHMTSHYTWGSVTTLNDFEGVSRWPLQIFFWALTSSWSWLLAFVWSGP